MSVEYRKVLICGYYGFANAGDEAMLMAVIEALKKMNDALDITVLSGNPQETALRYGVKAINRLDVFSVIKAMMNTELVISGGGSLLQDVTSKRSIYYYLGLMQLAKLCSRPVMLYGQGIGPINASFARNATSFVCKQIDLIAVRDLKSQEELLSLGINKEKVHLTADAVMTMDPVEKIYGEVTLKKYGVEEGKPVFGIAARDWASKSDFKFALAQAAEALVEKYDAYVVFLSLQYPEDLAISNEIASLMNRKDRTIVISERCGIAQLLSLVGNMNLLISIRLHALIFGALMNVPVLGISYDPKIEGFLEGIDSVPVSNISNVTKEKLLEKVEEVINDDSIIKKQNECVESLRAKALKNAQLAISLLK